MPLVASRHVDYSVRFNYDRTTSVITKLDIPEYFIEGTMYKMVQGGAKVTDLDTYLTGETHDPACADCGPLTGLRAYSAARPPHSEGLAITIAAYLANETNCANINLLHLTSRKAVEAALG